MSDINEIIPPEHMTSHFEASTSESKLLKPIRKISRLPKCTPIKPNLSNQKAEQSDGNSLCSPTLDFQTKMKMKNKISELQQANNELKFKLTAVEIKLRTKDGEVIATDSLNKQLKHLLDKHINREHELNNQIVNLEKKISRVNKQLADMEEGIVVQNLYVKIYRKLQEK